MNKPNEVNVARRFPKETADFQLTVLHEDGEYRHLRFHQPGTRISSTDIHTWPGGVATSGDMGDGWQFERGLGFFGGPVKMHYWSEKLTRRGRHVGEEFSIQVLRAELKTVAEGFDIPDDVRPSLDDAIEELVNEIDAEAAAPDAALQAIDGFAFYYDDEDGVRCEVSFWDPYEMDVTDYEYHLVWACHVLSTAAKWLESGDARVIRPTEPAAA